MYNLNLENKNKINISFASLVVLILSAFAFIFAANSNSPKNFESENQNLNFDEIISDISNLHLEDSDSTNLFGSDTTRFDSLNFSNMYYDSTKFDSMKLDSTYRLKNFKYVRTDNKFLSLKPERKIGFYAYPSERFVKRTVELDSTGSFVIIREFIANNEIRFPIKIPIEEYIEMRLKNVERGSWENLGYKYELKESADDLGQLIKDITNIEIPLPSVGILSIFGPPKISLKISGAVDIHGAWRNETTEGVTASLLGNTRNEPDFKQQVQINVNGLIGDKLTIGADWNTERTFEYENQLKLNYKGYKDEIVQSVEAGNVSLQTSPLVGGGEALFGIKALFQFGPFSLTALASQKKSEIEEVAVSGGTQKSEFEIHAYDYSPNHYFVDIAYADPTLNLFEKYYANANPVVDNRYKIKEIEVWKTTSQRIDISKEQKANAYIDLDPRESDTSLTLYPNSLREITGNSIPGKSIIGGRFVRMIEGVDYDVNIYAGFISFRTQINTEDAIAVAYRTEGEPGAVDNYYGEFLKEFSDTSSVIVLKLVKPEDLQPGGSFEEAWKLQLKNIYPIGGRDVNKEGFKLDINYQVPGQEPVRELEGKNILETFGLDLSDESGGGNPDGAFDFDPGRTIFTKTGEIIFPKLQPFGRDFPFAKELAYQAVYDTTVTYAKNDKAQDKFIIIGEYSAAASSVYNIGFNVVENSVKVSLDGRPLENGTDYSVDYNIGQVIIRNADALVPGANLKITYEKNDLFQLASKTLLGFRGIYDVSEKTKFGFSYLNLNQTTLSDKVRIGEEPLNNSIFGLDFQTGIDLPFLTKGLDYLISTKEMSSFNVKGEFAYMSPDPNTKKSNIKSDNDQSIAYIDDFEGAKRIIPIGVNYTGWKDISIPDSIPGLENLENSEIMEHKAHSYWFNRIPSSIRVDSIWGNRKDAPRKDNDITVMDFIFNPSRRGTYNYNPNLDNRERNWGGMMRGLSSSAGNLVEENVEYIEFWVDVIAPDPNKKIIIDLGQISEDIVPNNVFDTEDKIANNDILDEGEDTGLDGLTDAQEIELYGDVDGNGDPSNDNFTYSPGSFDYSTINGTEGNAKLTDVGGRLPDAEDLKDRDYTLDKVNSYFRYEIPLDTSKQNNPFISGIGEKNWRQFRIPLRQPTTQIGTPTLTLVEAIRFWVSGLESTMRVRFAEMNLVGNQWQKVIIPGKVSENDTTLEIATINYEDDPSYISPPGVTRERDRTQTEEVIYKNEQALKLSISKLKDGENREIVKYLFKPLDVFDYKEMKLFIRGDQNDLPGSISYYEDENNYGTEVYFRFGTDTSHFYEYRMPVTKGDPLKNGWSEISILFEKLTAIKQVRTDVTEYYSEAVEGLAGHSFGVKGNPSLTKVNYFSFGIINPNNKGITTGDVSGEIWVNELRVLGADDTPGMAYSGSTQFKLADLLTVSLNASKTDPYFHKLSQRFGSRVDNSSWSGSVNLDVLKFIPWNLTGSSLSVNYARSETVSKPLYVPGTDINVDEAVKLETEKLTRNGLSETEAQNIADETIRKTSQSLNISDTWSLSSIKFKLPSKSWYIEDIINNLQFSFSFNKTYSRNPQMIFSSGWQWNGSGKYALNFSKENYIFAADIPLLGSLIELFKDYKNVKIYFSPQTFSTGLSASRRNSASLSRQESAAINTQRDFTAKRDFGFNWKITEGGLLNLGIGYNVNVASSFAHLLTIDDLGRPESDVWRDILNGQYFGKDYSYTQSFNLKTDPKLPQLWDLNKYLNITLGFTNSYNWQNNFKQDTLGRSGGFSNNIRAGLSIKLKSLTAPLFMEEKVVGTSGNANARNQARGNVRKPSNVKTVSEDSDETEKSEQEESEKEEIEKGQTDERRDENKKEKLVVDELEIDSIKTEPGTPIFSTALNYLKLASKWLFFDYENISMDFSQSVSASGSGIKAKGTGFTNFWGLQSIDENGPSRSFMLGLSRNIGPRAPNGNLSDNFSEKNSFDIKTSRPLWEGATVSLNWNVGWGMNKTTRITTDEFGNVQINDITSTGTLDKSYMFLPIFFSNSGISEVYKLYQADKNKNIAKAFEDGFESMPLLENIPILKEFSKYIPRANWRLDWRGLEKFEFLKGIAKSVSLNHAYNSSYTEGWKVDPDGKKQTQTQRINYGFAPLLGMNVTFDNIWGGNLTSAVKYSTKSSFDLGITTRNITESFTRDINITASFSKAGFSLPMFGLDLKNDIEMSLSYTSAQNSVVIFEMDTEEFSEKGKPQDGTTRTIIEPRIKYTLSSKVTLSIFYKRTAVEPEGASRIPPTTTNEAGLDVHIAIQP
ncbi:MAG: cell surface protein SprA [Ignavibacteriae bacterium]|nr:cell surface protein SprA [Ignavibacteriota bacterium]